LQQRHLHQSVQEQVGLSAGQQVRRILHRQHQ
jgi:hypothetical protein